MENKCPDCGEFALVQDSNGLICSACGLVVEEKDNIVSDIQFVEGPHGSHQTLGQNVSLTGAIRGGGSTRTPGFRKESRQTTIEAGRKRISTLANQLRMTPHHVDAGSRLFTLAVEHNFTQGRRSELVVASCLYIVARRENSSLLLIDFADVLNVDVYQLGQTFLQFSKLLNLELKPIDPSLYLHRFAGQLHFEEKTQLVTNTALRLIQRMSRDWIQTGRRPTGICGATLLIASRLHGFERTHEQIVKVVKIGEMTLRRRLCEFGMTPTASLTIEEFEAEKFTLESTCDPPAFVRAREEEERLLIAARRQKGNIYHGTTESLDRIVSTTTGSFQNDFDDEDLFSEQSDDFELIDWSEFHDTFSDIEDEELDECFNSPEEVKTKLQIWEELHKDYMIEQERKKLKEQELKSKFSSPTRLPQGVLQMSKNFIQEKLSKAKNRIKSEKLERKTKSRKIEEDDEESEESEEQEEKQEI